ncbi:hypothetical protein [Kitasatospora sp. NPDC056531]|uniref:hypothetical protein n=1 Tax=Kitasatospora sp. NPDC056531 TaxID=3345856 RepID=UPI003684A30F
MPSLLHYEIVTDPTSLQASADGAPSVGTVYIVVSNTHQEEVDWRYIDVAVPLGPERDRLTDDRPAIKPDVDITWSTPLNLENPTFEWDETEQAFRVHVPQAPTAKQRFPSQASMTLTLDNIPITRDGGLVLLTIREETGLSEGPTKIKMGTYTTTLAVVKQTPRVPRNFHPASALVDGDTGGQLELRWNGPDNLHYWIHRPDGPVDHIEPFPGSVVTDRPYSRSVPVPKRGTTYTLIAGTNDGGQQQRGYFLTTTVHAIIPEFGSGTRSLWVEGTVDKGRIGFTADGVDVRDPQHDLGRVTADKADVDRVITRLVQGRTNDNGWITFPDSGVNVYHGPTNVPGVVTAARADVDGVNTKWAGSRDAGAGWVEFTPSGASLHKDGNGAPGDITAGKANLQSVNTKWIGDRDGGKGWIGFPENGIDVRGNGTDAWGTVHAGKADVDGVNTKWVQGRSTSDGWIDFPTSGIRVYRDGGNNRGDVIAHKADLNSVNTMWVGDRDGGKGWIEFPENGVDVRKGSGQVWGTVSADTADLNSVTAKWVEGPNGTKSRLAFTDTGVKITDPDGHRGTIVAGETNVRSVVTPWVSGPMPDAGWIAFRVEGVDVMRDSEVSFGTIRAATYEDKQGGTGRALHRRLPPYDWPPKSQ